MRVHFPFGSATNFALVVGEPAENGESINGNRMRRKETAGDRAGDTIDEGVARSDRDESTNGTKRSMVL